MTKRAKVPSTPALRWLRAQGIEHTVHTYAYVERGGAAASAAALGWELHDVVKTLVFEDQDGTPLLVLMHGDASVSAKELARSLGKKSTTPCDPAVAEKHSGYRVGGTSPFGTRKRLATYVERTVLARPRILINGGSRGVLVELKPAVLVDALGAIPVDVAR